MASEQVDQGSPEVAQASTDPNAHQPRAQAFGADDLPQPSLELEQLSVGL